MTRRAASGPSPAEKIFFRGGNARLPHMVTAGKQEGGEGLAGELARALLLRRVTPWLFWSRMASLMLSKDSSNPGSLDRSARWSPASRYG